LFKGRSPIDIPIDKDCAWITCDGEQKWLPIHTRRVSEIIDIWGCVFGQMDHGTLPDFEVALG